MSQEDQLSWATGLYKHDEKNHFLITSRDENLYVKIDSDKEEKLNARGDGLYHVENTDIKVKFHRPSKGAASSITLFFPDRQVVATRKVILGQEQSYFSKVKELIIFAVLFLILVLLSPFIYKPIKNRCLESGSAMSCRVANLASPLFSSKKEREAIHNELSKTDYSQARSEISQACEDGNIDSCLEVAKQKFNIGAKDSSYQLLENNCYKAKHGPSCQKW